MELFLNTVWLLLALTTLGFWVSLCHARRNRWLLFRGLIVLGCVLTLLFPVISMTDDLHAQQAAMEDAAVTTKKLVKSGEHAKALLHAGHLPAVVTASSAENALKRGFDQVVSAERQLTVAVPPPHTSGRAPPSLA
jgi:hypothetical protein